MNVIAKAGLVVLQKEETLQNIMQEKEKTTEVIKIGIQELSYIFRKETKMAQNGQIIEEKQLTVQGNSLKECKTIFDKEWTRKK